MSMMNQPQYPPAAGHDPFGAAPGQPYGPQPGPYGTQPGPYGTQPGQPFGVPQAQPFGVTAAPPFGVPPGQPYGPQPGQPFGVPPGHLGYPPMAPPPNNQTRTWVIILVLLLAAGVGGFLWYNNKDNPTPVPATQPPATQPQPPPATQPQLPPATRPPIPNPPATTAKDADFADSERFMGYMIAGNAGGAYAMMAQATQAQFTQDELKIYLDSLGLDASCKMKWTAQTAGPFEDGQLGKEDEGVLTCANQTKNVWLQWALYDKTYLLEDMNFPA